MVTRGKAPGLAELRAENRKNRHLFWAVGLFSIFANLLMLAGPLYMLQIYDRVLGSGSVATLIALTGLVAFLYTVMALLDQARARIMARAGARLQAGLERRVFDATLQQAARRPEDSSPSGLRDLEAVQRLMASPVVMALFDMPWVPVFLIGITIFHPWLGYLAVAGGAILILVTLANQSMTRTPVLSAAVAQNEADHLAQSIRTDADLVQALGMQGAAFDRWQRVRDTALIRHLGASDIGAVFGALSKSLRLFLQSAMLGLGAWLVIRGEVTPGAMIAASILLGRALAPIEQAIGGWALVQRARQGWSDLAQLLSDHRPQPPRTALPRPQALLAVQDLTVIPPGERQPALRMLNFVVQPGQAVGVIGPSGAGKSTLARAVTGTWPALSGRIRLDGAALDQYDPAVLGQLVGYLPQRVQLFDGTIAENIARMSLMPDPAAVVAAARKAAAHEMILKLPAGYDTLVSATGGRLSGGQIQRIGLARAFYGAPVILVLDEPNAHLDNDGSQALNSAIRTMKAEGGSVLIMAHRPAAIHECDTILVLDKGTRVTFGPRDDVLRQVLSNHRDVQDGLSQGQSGGLR
jgi:PrtD family type I secretion system ABC transporter